MPGPRRPATHHSSPLDAWADPLRPPRAAPMIGSTLEGRRGQGALLNGTSGSAIGRCRRVGGLYSDRPDPARQPVRLFGRMPSPPAARPVWDAWREGPPRARHAWARFPTEGRSEWLRFAEVCLGPEEPGVVCELDGRYATDLTVLHCAIGEAVGGREFPRHQWGNALRGCQCGGEAARGPFTLVWHDADVSRQALAGVSVDANGKVELLRGGGAVPGADGRHRGAAPGRRVRKWWGRRADCGASA